MTTPHLMLVTALSIALWLVGGCWLWAKLKGAPDYGDHTERCVVLVVVGTMLLLLVGGFL